MTKVLVAEDNPVNREVLRELLENRGYSVIEAMAKRRSIRLNRLSRTFCCWTSACLYWMAMP